MEGAEKLFLEARYDKAVIAADKLIEGKAGQRDQLYYLKGLSELKLGRFKDARESFEYIVSRYPDSKVSFDALTGIGDAYYLEGNTHSALRIFNEVLEKYPTDRNISMIKDRVVKCRERLGTTTLSAAAPEGVPAAAPAPPQETSVLKNPPPSGAISVQVGSFKSKYNAERLARKLSWKSYDSFVDESSSASDKLYRVRVGHLNSPQEAESLAKRLKADGYSTKICADDVCR
jgi:tetratricopeptide (TPR) repeat protein